jgi:ankyrin repeat protein
MPTRPLPNDPSLEHLRKDAKRLRNGVRAKQAEALAQVHEFHPRGEAAVADFPLADAQLVIARSYGFASWAKLKNHLAEIASFLWSTPPPPDPRSPQDVFLRLACLVYGDWHRSNAARALRMLADSPELGRASVYAAAATGDVETVRDMVSRDPSIVNTKGGPLHWEPLLYACYSRMTGLDPSHSTLAVARLLLQRGADPNAGFLWNGSYAFTALTGAFGEGEDSINEPPHPECDALARVLLDAGADPNDSQALYNKHFKQDDGHLLLLLSYGLGRDKGGPWLSRVNVRDVTPQRLLIEELWSAAKNNVPNRVRLLVEHGVDVNSPGLRNGRTPYEEALRAGNDEIARYLLAHGARRVELDAMETFAAACVSGRVDDARAQLAADPSLLGKFNERGRIELVHRAVDSGRLDAVRFVVGLGFEVNGMIPGTGYDRTPLHNAAGGGHLEMVKLLLELGGSLTIRDLPYHATPIGWAAHNDQSHVVAYLLPLANIFDAVQCSGVEQVTTLLAADPSLAAAVDESGYPVVCHVAVDSPRLLEMIRALVSGGVNLNQKDRTGRTLLDRATERGLTDFAEVLRAHGARTADEAHGR